MLWKIKMSKRHYIIPIFVPHEGCPHNCVFCNQNLITGNIEKMDIIKARNIINLYLKTIKRENSIIEISFFGGTFTAIDIEEQKMFLALAKEYKDNGLVDFIHMSTRPDYINEAILTNLKNYSADIIELGIQSMDDEVLFKSGRGHNSYDVYKASKLIKEYGFTLGHQMMLGLPSDTFKKDFETAEKIIEMKPDIARIYPALVIKDTPMEQLFLNGKYKPYTLKESIEISKYLYSMLSINGINVIRMGLQPTEEINVGKDIISGPFHPAFKELVEGSLLNDMLFEFIKGKEFSFINIQVNEKDISKLYSNKKEFFIDMKNKIKSSNIKVSQCNYVEKGTILLETNELKRILDLNEFKQIKYNEGKKLFL
jgi:histone acetyltransferase (RNA polymerase elongator complex component)